ncbi:hypothetical protein [Planktothrix serta]
MGEALLDFSNFYALETGLAEQRR